MRALNIIRGISESFDVCSFVLYLGNYTQGLQTMAMDSAHNHGITNQHRAGYQLL
jgi:hypothetical protein